MSGAGWNPHKKGEHVFNDIAGSVENAFTAALRINRANSLMLTGRYGILALDELGQTSAGIGRFRRDGILCTARTVVAPATANVDDTNSRRYSHAKVKLETVLSEGVMNTAALIWKKKPRSNSSFHEFESIIASMRNSSTLMAEARSAFDTLIDSAHDPLAEASALSERVSDTELARRRAAIASMKEHQPVLKLSGHLLIGAFFEEVERLLERRIRPA